MRETGIRWDRSARASAGMNAVKNFISLALVIILIAVLHQNWPRYVVYHKDTPQVTLVQYLSSRGDYIVVIEGIEPDSVSVVGVNYILLDRSGSAVPGAQGSVKDIYCLDLDHEPVVAVGWWDGNMSFIDENSDGMVSVGDYFIIRHMDNGGKAVDGFGLLLKFEITGDKINGMGTYFTSDELWSGLYRTSDLTVSVLDQENFKLDNAHAIFDRFQILEGQEINGNLSFTYLGSAEGNITVRTIDEDGFGKIQVVRTDETNRSFHLHVSWSGPRHTWDVWKEMFKITIEVMDESSNRTMFTGEAFIPIMEVAYSSTSFSHPPPLQFITISAIFGIAVWTRKITSGGGCE